MAISSDFKDLLRTFNDYKVDYLIIGGYAVIKYTEPRYTKDIDIWIRANQKNSKLVFRALADFGAPLEGLTSDDFAHEDYFYQMGIAPLRVDILMSVSGLSFDEAWENRVKANFGDVTTNIISREDLIKTKKASGRPRDLIDAQLLEKVKNRA